MNINDLPSELLRPIFLHAGPKCWLYTVPFVCQSWSRVMTTIWCQVERLACYAKLGNFELTLWNGDAFSLGKATTKFDVVVKLLLVECGKFLKSLQIHGFSTFEEDSVLFIGRSCGNLQELTMNGNLPILGFSLSVACGDLSNLTEICLGDKTSACMSNLDISNHVGAVLETCRNLHIVRIEIRYCQICNFEVFHRLEGLPLEAFSLVITKDEMAPSCVENILTYLNRCSDNLKEVKLSLDCSNDSTVNMQTFRQLMTSLNGSKCIQILQLGFGYNGSTLWGESFIPSLLDFQHLQQLTLQNFDFSENVVLQVLQQVAVGLTLLRLEFNLEISDAFFNRWTTVLPVLETFELIYAEISTECLVKFVTTKCPLLNSLMVKDVYGVYYPNLIVLLHKNLHFCDVNVEKKTLRNLSPLVIRLADCYKEEVSLRLLKLCGLKIVDNNRYDFNCLSMELKRQCSKS